MRSTGLVHLLLAIGAALWLGGCSSLPEAWPKTASYALNDTADTRLGRAITPLAQANPQRTGLLTLTDGHEGFGMRLTLAEAAERSIDVQTFIWHADGTGMVLFDQMRRAAQRGVRVRLLIDDFNTIGLDPVLTLLDAEPNLEVRLFNASTDREHRLLSLLGDFKRLNRRMHNKSFTVDNQVSVVGGRNIGDEYFAANIGGNFIDLEYVVVGQAPAQISLQFDRYWNSDVAHPAAVVLRGVEPMSARDFDARIAAIRASPEGLTYAAAFDGDALVHDLLLQQPAFVWAHTEVVYDDPQKVLLPPGEHDGLLLPRLLDAMGEPKHELDLVSPYFVPDEAATQMLIGLAQRGVRVRVLTNSLAATDEVAVHAGYARHRVALLRGGVQLYELKPSAASSPAERDGRWHLLRRPGGSRTGLHAKVFTVDRERLFVGSYNLDPRSHLLNTEMGLLVFSPQLAAFTPTVLDENLPATAYELKLSESGQIVWYSNDAPPQQEEPETDAWRRFLDGFFRLLPIDELL